MSFIVFLFFIGMAITQLIYKPFTVEFTLCYMLACLFIMTLDSAATKISNSFSITNIINKVQGEK